MYGLKWFLELRLIVYAFLICQFALAIVFPEQFTVTVSPNPVSNVPVGSTVTLTCEVFISPEVSEDEVTVLWEKSGVPLCDPADCSYSITLTDIEASSEGAYICTVTVQGMEMGASALTFLTTVGESN